MISKLIAGKIVNLWNMNKPKLLIPTPSLQTA